MAVQAHDLRNRSAQFFIHDYSSVHPHNLLPPFAYENLNGFQPVAPAFYNYQYISQQPVASSPMLMIPTLQPTAEAAVHVVQQRKRRKESNGNWLRHEEVAVLPAIFPPMDSSPQVGKVSTGLRLGSDDDSSIVTSTRPDLGSLLFWTSLVNGPSTQLSKQQDDITELLRKQTEQLRFALEERTQLHTQALLTLVGDQVSHQLQERDTALERVSRKNLELEERVKILSLETHAWQSKAKSYDVMVTVLKANLQQALMQQSRCQDKMEGWGESGEVDDAMSAPIDEGAPCTLTVAFARKDAKRACKKCKSKEVSVLLLPCLHLCLCSDCNADVNRCPTCEFLISGCVEVFLS